MSVLIIDDNLGFVQRIGGLLRELANVGDINTAYDFEEAIKEIDKQMPDVALLDIHLPGKSGIELLKYIRHLDKSCCVLMATNQADEYHRTLCQKLGADYFLDKTYEFPRILEIVRTMKNQSDRIP